ncbi:MAG: MATE family efflux transporter [Proteobacteria bacterium]|nr:MATE family efflux transporter [Pseudomonadota bacterium]
MTAPRSYVGALLRLAGPVALARLGIIGMAISDVVVVGQLAPHELPHQALGWAPTAVFLVAAIGLLQGVQVLAARSLGEGNPQGAGVVLRRGLVLAIVAGAASVGLMWWGGERLFSPFGVEAGLVPLSARVMIVLALSIPLHLMYIAGTYFLEAIKKPAISTIIMWLANVVNLGLNLLWVPQHGAIGSAWATVGARVFLSGALLLWIFLLRDGDKFGVRTLGARGHGYGALLAVGVASAVSQAVEAGAFSGMTVIAGRLGANVVAGYQILLNLMAFVFMIALGMAAATAVLVSEAIGRKTPRDAARAGWTGIGLNEISMIVAAVAIFVFAVPIGHAYTADVQLAALISSLIWICVLILHPDGAQVVAASALRARGDNWFPTFSHILAYAVVMPVLGYWFAEHLHMGVAGLLFAILASSLLSGGVLLLRWWAIADKPSDAGHADDALITGVAEAEVRDARG